MFQRKIDVLFKNLPNGFGMADDILVAGYEADGKDYDDTLQRVLQGCRQVILKLNKGKCCFRCTSVSFLCDIISRHGVKPDSQKLNTHASCKTKKKNSKQVQIKYIVSLKEMH